MSRVEVIGPATLYLGDGYEVVRALGPQDAGVSDESPTQVRVSRPPIGMDFNQVIKAAEAAASVSGGVAA